MDKNGIVVGRSDAVSSLEQWEPVFQVNEKSAMVFKSFPLHILHNMLFQDGKLALLAANSKFVSVSPDDDSVYAHSMTAGENEILKVFS